MANRHHVLEHNRRAWDRLVQRGNPWTIPVGKEEIIAARAGEPSIYLTETRPVPVSWFPPLKGADVLCLASGGGQQGPLMAATGARVTVLDNSPYQLAQDRAVAARDALNLQTVLGDMADLSMFDSGVFDLILHPVSNNFVPDILPVWREAFRVLRQGGELFAGFVNPVEYCFDPEKEQKGVYVIRHSLPYSDCNSISEAERIRLFGEDEPLEFSHTLESQIGGQLQAGFMLIDLFEDYRREEPIKDYMPSYLVTRARKP